MGTSKTYTATIRLGESTVTDDAEGEITATRSAAGVTEAAVRAGVEALTGKIEQVPSSVSAIKVNRERAYARVAVRGEVKLAARPVTIHRFEIHEIRVAGRATARPSTSTSRLNAPPAPTSVPWPATSVTPLGVGGHLTALRRTQAGPYTLDQAHTLEQLAETLDVLKSRPRPGRHAEP